MSPSARSILGRNGPVRFWSSLSRRQTTSLEDSWVGSSAAAATSGPRRSEQLQILRGLKVFQEEQLWSTEDAVWVIAAWVARNFQDRDRLECACEWQERLDHPFTEKIEQRLLHAKGLDETWIRVWRLFCLVEPVLRSDTACYEMRGRLVSGPVLYSDLQKAVSLLAPDLSSDDEAILRWVRTTAGNRPALGKLSGRTWPAPIRTAPGS